MSKLLRWFIGNRDVSCVKCGQPMYVVKKNHLCPHCEMETVTA